MTELSLTAKTVAAAVVIGIAAVGTGRWVASLLVTDRVAALAIQVVVTIAMVGAAGSALSGVMTRDRP
jgi:hypothetical protein